MYRRSVQTKVVDKPPLNVAKKTRTSNKFELLWRKKSTKVHKTWEGDAEGVVYETANGYEMVVTRDGGQCLGSVRFSSDPANIAEGSVHSVGSFEIEIVAPVVTAVTISSTPQEETVSPPPHKPVCISPTFSTPLSKKRNLGMPTPFRVPLKRTATKEPVTPSHTTTPNSMEIDPLLASRLRPHQREGVEFMRDCVLGNRHSYGSGCVLADDMGLGKTLTSIALLHTLLRNGHINNALVTCPVTLIANWRNEFDKWLPDDLPIRPRIGVMAVDQSGMGNGSLRNPVDSFFRDRQFKTHQIMIIGYERIRLLAPHIAERNKMFDLVICDEGHRLKTAGSKTAEAIASICDDKRIILTGTPIQNDLSEFYALANFVNPQVFGSESKFNRKYTTPISSLLARKHHHNERGNENNKGDVNETRGEDEDEDEDGDDDDNDTTMIELNLSQGDTSAHEALQDLLDICNEFMLRRTAATMEQYLPVPKTEFVVFCRPTPGQTRYYEQLVGQASTLLPEPSLNPVLLPTVAGFDQAACLQAISELRKAAAGSKNEQGGKIKFLSALIDETLARTNEKIVVVSGSTRVLDMCQSLCGSKLVPWLRIDGSTPQSQRQSSVQIFNKSSQKQSFVFLLSARSGGLGLNLVGASRLVLMDCDWNPAVDAQAMARIHRDGQKRACYIYRLLTTGTIDEKIFQRQLSKTTLSENMLLDLAATRKADFSVDALRDLFTMTHPVKCNTLESSSAGVSGYFESNGEQDEVLHAAVVESNNVSCILQRENFRQRSE